MLFFLLLLHVQDFSLNGTDSSAGLPELFFMCLLKGLLLEITFGGGAPLDGPVVERLRWAQGMTRGS